LKAREVIRVPTPYKVKDNILVMELIGEDGNAARELRNQYPEDPKDFFNKIKENIRKLYKHGLVHGDLSQYNILNLNDEPVFIDFSQATLSRANSAEELLERDVNNLVRFFNAKLNLKLDSEKVLSEIRK
jgi:RIO kinase 1